MNNPISLNDTQIAKTVAIFAHGARQANSDMRRILSSGHTLLTLVGTEVTLGMAVRRRRRCISKVKQALRGFIL